MPGKAALLSLSLACCAGPLAAAPPSPAVAQAAADLAAQGHSGDDIQSDFRAGRVQVADLDRDGRSEVVFLLTATCVQADFACANALTVLDALRPEDPRALPSRLSNGEERARLARLRAAGYGESASVQIPGTVESIRIADGRIAVGFLARKDSPLCAGDCPPPGRHTWHYAWAPGALTRLDAAAAKR